MPEYPSYPGQEPEQPSDGTTPPVPPPPPGTWPSAPQQPGYPPQGQPHPGQYPQQGQYPQAYPQQSQYPGMGWGVPKHQSATTAMVLGIISVAGTFLCAFPALLGPFAWYLGAKAVREIDASQGQLSGRSEATSGKVLGIIGTVLLVIILAIVVLLVIATIADPTFWDDDYSTY